MRTMNQFPIKKYMEDEKMSEPQLKTLYYIPEFGRQGWMVRCSVCETEFRVYEWSIHGTGKKCPGCGYLYNASDIEERADRR